MYTEAACAAACDSTPLHVSSHCIRLPITMVLEHAPGATLPPAPRKEGAQEVYQVGHKLAGCDHQHIDGDQRSAHTLRC